MRHGRRPAMRAQTRLRRGLARGATILLGAGCGLLATLPAPGEVVDRVVATIDGDPITMVEVQKFAATEVRVRQIASTDPALLLETLITERTIDKEFADQGLSVNEQDVDRYIAGIRQRNNLTEEQLTAALQQQGVAMDQYRRQIRDELQRAQLINREIRGKVNVTPEEVERYYEAHLADYETVEELAVSDITLKVPPDASAEEVESVHARAEKIYQELRGGADFGELARRYSEDAAAESGGSLGKFKTGELIEVLEKAVIKLQPGQFSEPVRSPVGFHIVRLDERLGASHQPLESLAAEIKEKLYNAALEERYNRWLREDLRKRHHVEILP
jgi:peptidyl-prolyl cis-trans isomerase SurA